MKKVYELKVRWKKTGVAERDFARDVGFVESGHKRNICPGNNIVHIYEDRYDVIKSPPRSTVTT